MTLDDCSSRAFDMSTFVRLDPRALLYWHLHKSCRAIQRSSAMLFAEDCRWWRKPLAIMHHG